jgi:type IV secretory pathway VirJ component
MKKIMKRIFLLIVMSLSFMIAQAVTTIPTPFAGLKQVWVYGNTKNPASVVIILSGDGGWILGVVDVAKNLANHNAMVIGVSSKWYMMYLRKQNKGCYSLAADFEQLGKYIQGKYHIKYIKPIILGYSSGATLAYGVIAQASAHTFQGAISLGFCSDLNVREPLCEMGDLECHKLIKKKGFDLSPVKSLQDPFIVLQGTNDKTCHLCLAQDFVNKTPNAELFELNKIQHGALTLKKWIPKILEAYELILHHKPLISNNV